MVISIYKMRNFISLLLVRLSKLGRTESYPNFHLDFFFSVMESSQIAYKNYSHFYLEKYFFFTFPSVCYLHYVIAHLVTYIIRKELE